MHKLGAMRPDHWEVTVDVPDNVAYRVLAQDRVWNCFAIADLAPPFRTDSQYAVAHRGDAPPSAVCLVLRHPAFTMLIPSGDTSGVAAIFAALDLPEATEFQVQESHLSALEAPGQARRAGRAHGAGGGSGSYPKPDGTAPAPGRRRGTTARKASAAWRRPRTGRA